MTPDILTILVLIGSRCNSPPGVQWTPLRLFLPAVCVVFFFFFFLVFRSVITAAFVVLFSAMTAYQSSLLCFHSIALSQPFLTFLIGKIPLASRDREPSLAPGLPVFTRDETFPSS